MTMDAVERRGVDGREPLSLLAEVLVAALRNQLVVALDGLLERGRVGDAQLLGKLVKGIRLKRCDLPLVNALLLAGLFGHVRLDGLLVEQLARPACSRLGVVVVEDLAIVALIGVAAQEVVHKRHAAGLIAKARAVHLHRQKRHIAHGARTGVEVMEHLRVTEVLHRAAGPNGHLVSVAGLVRLLAAEMLQIRKIVVHHLVVVLVIAGSQGNALFRVELNVALGTLGDNARDARCVAHELFRLGGVEEVDTLLFRILGQRLHAFAGVVGLRAKVDRQVVHLVVVDLCNA